MLLRMLTISNNAREPFGQIVAAGILAMFTFNIFENISKEIFKLTDTYVIDVVDPRDALQALMLVIAIDVANCKN